jgi:hypothetical protein
MRYGPSLRGFTVGVLVGTILGSAGVAAATFGLKGWSRFSEDFRNGYVNGFLDMANLARNLEPGGWVDKRYPQLPAVRPQEWRGVIDKLYTEPANKDYLITSAMQLAAKRLEDRYGKAEDPLLRQKKRSEAQMAAVRRKLAAEGGAGEAETQSPKVTETQSPKVAETESPKTAETESPKVAAPEAGQEAVAPRTKKWCRCDGTDPKAAREKRRAEAAAAEAAEEAAPQRGAAP